MDFWTTEERCARIDRYKDNKLCRQLVLEEVTEDELLQYRSQPQPGLIFVANGRTFYTPLSKNIHLDFGKKHRCSLDGTVCNLLSPLPDELGGCAKVRDISIDSLNGRFTDLKNSKRIEKYTDFIQLGYETFNFEYSHLVVFKCSHYQPAPPSKPLDPIMPN